ncbi:MAG: hypothetical protein Q4P18_03600 [Methanobrevibacter sp.]|uniref:hypothetical protein n=1 Tax=Methanobrevibacter sp. TaxID=66852 RepID=UPI0026E05612|nr:hypothetical protein [Methanobrevibacter sp.]MDO5848595.1 hypothetical protein [Methanobrevibacter sp.]
MSMPFVQSYAQSKNEVPLTNDTAENRDNIAIEDVKAHVSNLSGDYPTYVYSVECTIVNLTNENYRFCCYFYNDDGVVGYDEYYLNKSSHEDKAFLHFGMVLENLTDVTHVNIVINNHDGVVLNKTNEFSMYVEDYTKYAVKTHSTSDNSAEYSKEPVEVSTSSDKSQPTFTSKRFSKFKDAFG